MPATSPRPLSSAALDEIRAYGRDAGRAARFALGTARLVWSIIDHHFRLVVWLLLSVIFVWTVVRPAEGQFAMVGGIFSLLLNLMFMFLFGIVQFVGIMWFIARPRKYTITPDGGNELGLSLADYRGNPELLSVLRDCVAQLRDPAALTRLNAQPTRGVLLHGFPGGGKSYAAQCVASEAGVPFIYLGATSLQSMWFGVGNLIVKQVFGQARSLARKYGTPERPGACIVFIDEIDAVAMSRGNSGGSTGNVVGMWGGGGTGLLNELLMQMDPPPVEDGQWLRFLRGLGLRKGKAVRPIVQVWGATNAPLDVLDVAILREGRFDIKIRIDPPTADGRRDLLDYYLAKVEHEDLDLDWVVGDTIGYSPASIRWIVNQAALFAVQRGDPKVTYQHLADARKLKEWGLRQPISAMAEDERRITAYHEAGHAAVQSLLMPYYRLAAVTIIRHGDALGLSQPKPTQERYTQSADELFARMMAALGSRAAEEVILGGRYSGASHDLQTATVVANAMIASLGMASTLVVPQAIGIPADGRAVRQVEDLLQRAMGATKRFITEQRPIVERVAQHLLEHDEVDSQKMDRFLAEFAAATGASDVATLRVSLFETYVRAELAQALTDLATRSARERDQDLGALLRGVLEQRPAAS